MLALTAFSLSWAGPGTPSSHRRQQQHAALRVRLCGNGPEGLGSSLKSTFEAGLTLQRAGDERGALGKYELFVQAAEQCDVPPLTYAEVLVNMGTIFARRRDRARAQEFFAQALRSREIGSAHLNLALVELADAAEASRASGRMPQEALDKAAAHCRRAIELRDDPNSIGRAQSVLCDIERTQQ